MKPEPASKIQNSKPETRLSAFGFRLSFLNKRGFTLLEVIIIIVLVGIFMAAIGLPFVSGIRESHLPEIVATAHFLAAERLEELAGADYDALADEPRAAVSGYLDYEREVDETEVTEADLSTPEAGSGYRTVRVTVYHNDLPAAGISLETLRADY
ncbi:MAG: prepilin-type N-terminal cleavage/methylation domain-containing protein [Syntrophobacteria bacterium]